MSKRILTVGAACMTMTVRMDNLPEAERTALSSGGLSFSPGGEGGINAVALARYGAESFLCTRLGSDAHGKRLTDFYAQSAVRTDFIALNPDKPTCTACHIHEAESDTHRTVLYHGAAETVMPQHVEAAFESSPQALLLTADVSPEIIAYSCELATERSIPIFFEASPVTADFDFTRLPKVTVLTLNETETEALTGVLPTGSDSCLLAGIALQKIIDAEYYVIKLGKRGSYIYDGIYCHSIAPFVVPASDTAGAGAAFNACLILSYLSNGENILQAARTANAAGALAVQKNGLYKALPTHTEVEEFLRHHTR